MTNVDVHEGKESAFASWQAAFTRSVTAAPGFVSVEIIPGFAGGTEWRITQRFQTPKLLEMWRTSSERVRLFAELAGIQNKNDAHPLDEVAPDFHSLSCVTEVITTTVEPGREAEFHAWAEVIQAKQATFPGYMGTLIQAPLSPDVPYWTTLVRFSTPELLDSWLGSDDRKTLLERSDPRVSKWKSQRLPSPFAGWFPTEPDRAPPAAWKQSMIVLLVLFPVVMLEIRFLNPLLTGLHVSFANFIGNAISVALTGFLLIPCAIYCLTWWLQPASRNKTQTELLGFGTVIVLYAIEVLFFWFVF